MSVADQQIRNVQQSVQYRDVTKQASDIIVFIDGQDYLLNPYLGESGVAVPLNDFVINWQSSYSIESMVPSGTLTLSIGAESDHLFRLPGGMKLLKTMAEIRVYAKGFYLSPRGNTLYHQIFKGYLSNISYVPTSKLTTITCSCKGALGILEQMQVEQNPSTMSSSPQASTAMTSTCWNLDPYQSIAWVFLYSSMVDGFERYSILQAAMDKTSPYYDAVTTQYAGKWQALLYDLARDVHIFGAPNTQDVIADIAKRVKPPDNTNTEWSYESLGALGDKVGSINESNQATTQDEFYQQLREFMPDMGIGNLQLINGRVTSRLERLRYLTNLIGFEAYQDVDGGIVIKPPLYNLDVVDLEGTASNQKIDPSLTDLSDTNNPFVVQLSEILNETETEDEAAVHMTRVTARGSYNPAMQWNAATEMQATAEDIDVGKLAQFGLRTEPPKEAHWFRDGDAKALYAYAASEMARANRGFRTYSITIPLRPELKLGFPMYLPHADIYGYIHSITMSWTKGGTPVTSISLDSVRNRPLLPETQAVTTNGVTQNRVYMTPQKDLVLQWTKAATKTEDAKAENIALTGSVASLPLPEQLAYKQALQIMEARKRKSSDFGVNSDDVSHCWRIQEDTSAKFNKARPLDGTYYDDLRSFRPYTDQKGYELVGPFPWGRWKGLKESLTLFTISNALGDTSTNPVLKPVSAATATLSNANAFLFSGDASLATVDDTSSLVQAMVQQSALINSNKVFELAYTTTASSTDTSTAQAGLSSTLKASAPASNTMDAATSAALTAATVVSNQVATESLVRSILASVPVAEIATIDATLATVVTSGAD